jgi:hypothetical protein
VSVRSMLEKLGIRGPIKATPGTAVTGWDKSAIIRSCAKQIWEAAERGEKRRLEADRLWKYEQQETYVLLAKRITPDLASAREGYEVVMTTPVPGVEPEVFCYGRGWTIKSAEIDLRFRLARTYIDGKVARDFDEARLRASKVTLLTERSFALGTGGKA